MIAEIFTQPRECYNSAIRLYVLLMHTILPWRIRNATVPVFCSFFYCIFLVLHLFYYSGYCTSIELLTIVKRNILCWFGFFGRNKTSNKCSLCLLLMFHLVRHTTAERTSSRLSPDDVIVRWRGGKRDSIIVVTLHSLYVCSLYTLSPLSWQAARYRKQLHLPCFRLFSSLFIQLSYKLKSRTNWIIRDSCSWWWNIRCLCVLHFFPLFPLHSLFCILLAYHSWLLPN